MAIRASQVPEPGLTRVVRVCEMPVLNRSRITSGVCRDANGCEQG